MGSFTLLVALGVLAGIVTTVAGLGGGVMLLLALSLVWDPRESLAVTAIALLIGNVHRVWLLWRQVSRPVVGAFAIGAVPGAIFGGLLAVAVPAWVVHVFMAVSTLLSIVHALSRSEWRPGPKAIAPLGLVIGVMTGAAGGAAVLTSPLFLAAGLAGESYIASLSASAVVMHVSRVFAYAIGGHVRTKTVAWAAVLALAILAGNLTGRKLRVFAQKLPQRSLEYATLVACVVLAIAGLGS